MPQGITRPMVLGRNWLSSAVFAQLYGEYGSQMCCSSRTTQWCKRSGHRLWSHCRRWWGWVLAGSGEVIFDIDIKELSSLHLLHHGTVQIYKHQTIWSQQSPLWSFGHCHILLSLYKPPSSFNSSLYNVFVLSPKVGLWFVSRLYIAAKHHHHFMMIRVSATRQ